MAPFTEALNTRYAFSKDGADVYGGHVDGDWTITAIPHGGYILALIVDACIQYQSSTEHRDPIHVSAHYLQASSVAPFEVHMRTLKKGKGYSNVIANLIQKDRTKVTCHIIFGTLTPTTTDPGPRLTLLPPSRYARRLPLHSHPSTAALSPLRSTWNFRSHAKWAEDPVILAKNKPESETRTNSATVGGGGLEWGAWFQFVDEHEQIKPSTLAFLVDIFQNIPQLLPRGEMAGPQQWYPTMALALEFKSPIPTSSDYSHRAVGLYSSCRFINDPQGHHDAYVEVWTAPSNIGEGDETEGWRDKQVCLAVATQMALTLSSDLNMSIGGKNGVKL